MSRSPESEEKEGFRKEIALMLHGFGDAAEPLPATVALVESVAASQARAMARAAAANAERRGREAAGAEDVVFLLRRSEPRLRRTLGYLRLKAELAETKRREAESTGVGAGAGAGMGPSAERALLGRVAEFADDADRPDEISEGLRRRSDAIAESLPADKYAAYHRARCASFARGRLCSRAGKFGRWADPDGRCDALALRLLAHLAHETVGQIADLAFLARRDAKSAAGEPFAKLEGGYCDPPALEGAFGASGGEPLTPAHVREAVRRFFSPRIGVNGRFFRNVDGEPRDRFLCA